MNKCKRSTMSTPVVARLQQDSWMKQLQLQTVEVNTARWTDRSAHLREWRAKRAAARAPRLH